MGLAKSPYISKCQQSVVCRQGLSVFLMSLRAQRGNLVAVAMMVPRHVLNLNEIATRCAPRNDNRMTLGV